MIKVEKMQYEGIYCALSVEHVAPGVMLLLITGHDVGEFGDAPMKQLEAYMSPFQWTELFIDARHTKGASVEVSNDWAQWLGAHRTHFKHISMLTGSRFIRITADFVRSFADLGDLMRIYTDGTAFDEALAASIAAANAREG